MRTDMRRGWSGPRRRAAILALVALTAPALAQAPAPVEWRVVAPGVEHAQITRVADAAGQPAGPWTINALRLDLARVRLDVVRALDAAIGLETVSSLATRHGAIAAVNGGYFRTTGTFRGDSTGTLQIDGTLLSEPDRGRAAVGFVRSGRATRMIVGHVSWTATLDAGGRRTAVDGVNRPRGDHELVVFTPEFHRTTLTDPSGIEAVVRDGAVTDVREQAGSTPIPPGGFVVSVTGDRRTWAREALRVGTPVSWSARLQPADGDAADSPWADAEDIVGAGPKLVTRGRVDVTVAREKMTPGFATDRHPRSAIASLANDRALLLVVDGRQPLRSIGMTLDELARLLIELGAEEAVNLDGGGSTAMVVEGKLVNRPSDASGERPVSDAILVRPVSP